MISFKKYFLNEAPISDIATFGNWESKSKNKYDEPSIKLLSRPSHIEKIKSTIAKNIDINFNLYFIKSKKASQHVEVGEVNKNKLQEMISDVDVSQILQNMEDTITVVFTNNVGVEKVPLTTWMIAHRISHVLFRYSYNNTYRQKTIDIVRREIVNGLNGFLQTHFNISVDRNFDNLKERRKLLKILNKLGKFRSARENKINRPFEFLHELLAEYLITGEISLNDIANDEPYTYELNNIFQYNFDYLLGASVGKIFVM